MHAAKDEQDDADLAAEALKDFLGIGGAVAVLEGEGDVADIDEVKADDEEVIDGIGEEFVSVEAVDEERCGRFCGGCARPRR